MEFNGDYAGYAQAYLEEDHPGAIALFMEGCGGDQNPLSPPDDLLCGNGTAAASPWPSKPGSLQTQSR